MPAGIGLVMIAGQLYALADSKAPDTTKFGPVDPSIFVADEDEEGAE
ncbi:hypothetical protein ABZ723_33595 [Streptomyces sp. NPDC006700]